jgi:hypothetical protein
MHTEILIPWTTVAGVSPVTTIIQDQDAYVDAGGASEMVFYIDVLNVSTGGGAISLTLESGPTNDAAFFLPVAGPIALAASTSTLIMKTVPGAVSVFPLSRFLRWHVTAAGSSSTWSVTFRVRAARSRTPFFSPTLISGCILWLRSDLGVAASGGWVSTWADQSGIGNNATATATSVSYTAGTAAAFPIIGTAGGTGYLTGNLTGNASNTHTVFAVATFPATTSNMGAIAATIASGAQDTAYSIWSNTTAGNIVNGRTSGGGMNADAKQTPSTTGVLTIYGHDANASTSNLYVNGSAVGTASTAGFTPGTPTRYALLARSVTGAAPLGGPCYEFIAYNYVLSAAQRLLVHRYLGARYGITVP